MRITQRKVFDLSEVNEADLERIADWYKHLNNYNVDMDARDHELGRMFVEALRG
jgi:hypothetical protein